MQAAAETSVRRRVLLAGTMAVFGVSWLLRWLTVSFTNDHFVHLSRGRQILFGELPVRDFFDPGLILQYYASAAALAIFGNSLAGEAVLTVTCVALGAALTFYVAARASGSLIIAAAAAAVAVATFPRLYNYPKVLLYVLALYCAQKYAERPANGRLIALAGVTVVAFLLRHDHGAYIGVSIVALLVLTHRESLRAMAGAVIRYGTAAGLMVLPFLLFIQTTVGVGTYIRQLPETQPISALRLVRLPLDIDWSQPLLALDPPSSGHIMVRWRDDVDAARRGDLEARHGLTQPVAHAEGWWRYDVPAGHGGLQSLVADPAVADTSGIDRETFKPVVHHGFVRRVRNLVPLLRMRIAPGIATEQNALAWLYYATMLVPFAGAVAVILGWRSGSISAGDLAMLGTTVVMCAVINQGLIRESPDSRLPDVAGPAVVLGAALSGLMLRRGRRLVRGGIAATLWAVTLWSATVHGHAVEQLASSRLIGAPRGIVEQWRDVTRRLYMRPVDLNAPPGSTGLRALTRYVYECTTPSDRLLVTWFAPELFFYSERLFAGGQVYLDPGGWHSSPADQVLTVQRLRSQRVPIVLVSAEWERMVEARFAHVYLYLRKHFTTVARSNFGGTGEYAVMAASAIPPTGTYGPLGLPCFR